MTMQMRPLVVKGLLYFHKAGGDEKIATNYSFSFLIFLNYVIFNPTSLIHVAFVCLLFLFVCFSFPGLNLQVALSAESQPG